MVPERERSELEAPRATSRILCIRAKNHSTFREGVERAVKIAAAAVAFKNEGRTTSKTSVLTGRPRGKVIRPSTKVHGEIAETGPKPLGPIIGLRETRKQVAFLPMAGRAGSV